MENQTPLFFVIAAIIVLWLLGKILAKASASLAESTPPSRKAEPKGNEIAPGLHVIGLSDTLMQEMHEIIEQQNTIKLAYFFTKRCPEFPELDNYFSELRSQYFVLLGKPSNEASETEKIDAMKKLDFQNTPQYLDINVVTQTELKYLIEDTVKTFRVITDELICKFGGENFFDNFRAYTQLGEEKPITLHIPPDHQHRKKLESLVETGIAIRGRKIPLKDRLGVLKFSQLRRIATELKIDTPFKQKSEATEALAAMPGSAVHLAMIHDISDIFYLKPETYNAQAVEDEWAFFNAYARLLTEALKIYP
ncbi:MAG: hypothetical protein GXP08_13750 [Gammaproteobacteria bacterium]|nr:hypothetical protein [Gammaproteobacteria bacterium]